MHPDPSIHGKEKGKKWKQWQTFILLGSKITADGDCSEETLAPWKKSCDKPRQHIKSRDITLPIKVCIVKAMVFPVGMYRFESWTIKKTEHQRSDAFKLWCWRRLLKITWTARRSNQSILKEISPEYSLEGLMLKLKLDYFGYLMWGANSLEKIPMLGKIEGKRRRGQQRMRWLDIHWFSGRVLSKLWEIVKNGEAWRVAVHGVTESWTHLSDWPTTLHDPRYP